MKKVKVGLLGIGTVGSGTWKILNENKDDILRKSGYEIEVKKVLVKDINKKRDESIPVDLFTQDFEDILNDDEIEIVVEVMGGIEPAKEYILKAIEKNKHIVTANKALIATHGREIFDKANEQRVKVLYEASVAGGIPILQTIKDSLAGNKIEEIMGIVNGTTNYILTKMAKDKVDFNTVLKKAQEMGYAEADPTADIQAFDAAHKLTILSSLSFGTNVSLNDIYREGITSITPIDIEYANELGYAIKLLAIGKDRDGVMELRVHPTFIPLSHPLASVSDAFNAVFLKGNAVGELMFYGKGAGDLPTGSAVVGDIIHILNGRCGIESKDYHLEEDKIVKKVKPMLETRCEYYVRVLVIDKPGILGRIASLFGKSGVSLSSVIQKGLGDSPVSLVFVTHMTNEGDVKNAIKDIVEVSEVIEIANVIRVENNYRGDEE